MLYRRFGKTELQLPVISFGCMRSMHCWQDRPLSQIPESSSRDLETLVGYALSRGMLHIETAHGYGSSERQLGTVLPHLDRDAFILQTKVVPQRDPRAFVRTFQESLTRMQVDCVDLLALHGINDYASLWKSCRPNGCLAAARELQRQGKVRHVGFSGHGPLEVILDAINHQQNGGFDFVNLHWYYIYDINRPAIERAAERDLGVYIISPTDKGGMLHTPPPLLAELCQPYSPITFNDLYCLLQPGVTSISMGAQQLADFQEHLNVLELINQPPLETMKKIIMRLETAMEQTVHFRRPEGFWQQLPEWQACPGAINVRLIHWLGNLAKGWQLEEYARSRYNMLRGDNSWVAGNNGAALEFSDFSEISKTYPAVTKQFLDSIHEIHTELFNTKE